MRVSIDASRCAGHGLCYAVAAGVFEDDDKGFGRVKAEFAATEVTADLYADAELAADSCPEQAIVVAE